MLLSFFLYLCGSGMKHRCHTIKLQVSENGEGPFLLCQPLPFDVVVFFSRRWETGAGGRGLQGLLHSCPRGS